PVPGATDVAALLAEAHVGEAALHQAIPKKQCPKARANDQDLALVVEWLPRHRRLGIDVLQVLREIAFHRHVVGSARPRRLELTVATLLLGVEGGTGRGWRERG